jgi:hypothetical protein
MAPPLTPVTDDVAAALASLPDCVERSYVTRIPVVP